MGNVELDVVDFAKIKRVPGIEKYVGSTMLIKQINKIGSNYAYVEVVVGGEDVEVKVRGKVLLKQLRLMQPYLAQGLKVRATLMKKVSRNGVEYYVFV